MSRVQLNMEVIKPTGGNETDYPVGRIHKEHSYLIYCGGKEVRKGN